MLQGEIDDKLLRIINDSNIKIAGGRQKRKDIVLLTGNFEVGKFELKVFCCKESYGVGHFH